MADDDSWYERERFHFAASQGDLDEARQLIASGYDVNAFDDIARTPLHYAAAAEDLLMVQLLLDSGADVNAHDDANIGDTPLAKVAEVCSSRMAAILLEAGADPSIPGWMGLTALDRASKRTDSEGQEVLRLIREAMQRC